MVGVDGPFTELGLSMASMPLALQYIMYFLGLWPECHCIIDGWNFLSIDAEEQDRRVLSDFLDLFGRPAAASTATAAEEGQARFEAAAHDSGELRHAAGNERSDPD